MIQVLGFVFGKLVLLSPGLISGWLHLGVAWAVAGSVAIAGATTFLVPVRPIPNLEGAPRFVRTKAFFAVAIIFAVLNLLCYGLSSWLSSR